MLQIVILLNKPNKQYCVWIATYLCEKVKLQLSDGPAAGVVCLCEMLLGPMLMISAGLCCQ